MGQKLKDRVREAYFLADPEKLKKVYLRQYQSKTPRQGKYSLDEFQELQRQNTRLYDEISEMKKELNELKGEVLGV